MSRTPGIFDDYNERGGPGVVLRERERDVDDGDEGTLRRVGFVDGGRD